MQRKISSLNSGTPSYSPQKVNINTWVTTFQRQVQEHPAHPVWSFYEWHLLPVIIRDKHSLKRDTANSQQFLLSWYSHACQKQFLICIHMLKDFQGAYLTSLDTLRCCSSSAVEVFSRLRAKWAQLRQTGSARWPRPSRGQRRPGTALAQRSCSELKSPRTFQRQQ